MLEDLLIPRKLTRALMLGGCTAICALAWQFLDAKLLGYLSGVAGPFCLLCATAVWNFREKIETILGGEQVSSKEFMRQRAAAKSVRLRAVRRAGWVGCCALMAASPAISLQVSSHILYWMVLIAGVGISESAYNYLVAESWDEELRAMKDAKLFALKVEAERLSLLSKVEYVSARTEGKVGWERGQSLPTSSSH